ncbi:uncharacterized protein LOC132295441 isoform X2 [Cornus florida]|uniref:uncharacterized protein LOC132295441 isoform X2 n=1 Tax=Cornus florida TaxID=4283 RepID=UPI00289D41D1|nr:uncharacterized protein LOC132295441 isoform X2 [Cornus florida]
MDYMNSGVKLLLQYHSALMTGRQRAYFLVSVIDSLGAGSAQRIVDVLSKKLIVRPGGSDPGLSPWWQKSTKMTKLMFKIECSGLRRLTVLESAHMSEWF